MPSVKPVPAPLPQERISSFELNGKSYTFIYGSDRATGPARTMEFTTLSRSKLDQRSYSISCRGESSRTLTNFKEGVNIRVKDMTTTELKARRPKDVDSLEAEAYGRVYTLLKDLQAKIATLKPGDKDYFYFAVYAKEVMNTAWPNMWNIMHSVVPSN